MASKFKIHIDSFKFNTIAEKEWKCESKGLKKVLISFEYKSMTKATELSKCLVEISNITNLNTRESEYLNNCDGEFWIQLGTALTPIDYYIEIFLQKMFTGEKCRCSIETKSSGPIEFTMQLNKIEFVDYVFRLNVKEMYDLALKYKENGVSMFKQYPIFANGYFCRAAKCLISFKPFDVLTEKDDGVNGEQMEQLLQILQSNIAACIMKEKRFEEVISLTKFVEDKNCRNEKAIYRRAVAFFNLRRFEEAKRILDKCECKENKEFLNLQNKVLSEWKLETDKYNTMVRKMFG